MSLQQIIDQAWEDRANYSPKSAPKELKQAVAEVLAQLDNGTLRVADRISTGNWTVNQWVKKAVLLSFRLEENIVMPSGDHMQFYDKVPTKFADYSAEDFAKGGFRVVPPAVARRGIAVFYSRPSTPGPCRCVGVSSLVAAGSGATLVAAAPVGPGPDGGPAGQGGDQVCRETADPRRA